MIIYPLSRCGRVDEWIFFFVSTNLPVKQNSFSTGKRIGVYIAIAIIALIGGCIALAFLLNKKTSDSYTIQPSLQKSLQESGFYSLATMLQATFGSHIYLDPQAPNFVAFNVITPVPDTLAEFIKRRNIIETPNLDVIYAPSVIDLRHQAILLTLPTARSIYYIVQFISITAEDVTTISTKTNPNQDTQFVLYSSSYAPSNLPGDRTYTYIHSPSSVLYMMIRVATNLQDPVSYRQSLNYLRQFSLTQYSFRGMPPARTDTLAKFKETFPDLSDIDVRDVCVDIAKYYNLFVKFMPLQLDSIPLFWTRNYPLIGIQPSHYDNKSEKELKDALTLTQNFEYNISIKGIPIKNNYNTSQSFYVLNKDPIANQIEVVGRAWLYIFANPPTEAIYFQSTVDSNQALLDGSHSYKLPVPTIPLFAPRANAFWSVCSYTTDGFNTLPSDFTVGKGQTRPTKVHMSSDINDKRMIPAGDLFLLVPTGKFYVVFRVYAPDDSIRLGHKNEFFPEMIERK